MKTASLLYCTLTFLIAITINGKSKKVKYVSFKSCIFKLYYSPQQFGTPLQNLPHIFSEMFSSSADRKQFHLQENSMPPLPPLPQHHHHPCFCSPSSPSLLFTVQAHRQAAEKQPWGLWFSTQYFLIRKKWQTDKNGIKAQRQTLSTRLVEGPKNILIYFHLKTSAYCLPIRYSSIQGCLYLPTTFLQNFYHRLQGCVIN